MTHIVSAFDDELNRLNQSMAQFGALAEAQLAAAIEALESRNSTELKKIIARDKELDALEVSINKMGLSLIALRAPMAEDLRRVVVALKVAGILERIGDYAKNMAKRTERVLSARVSSKDALANAASINDIAHRVQLMLNQVLDAYMENNVAAAMEVRARDIEVDKLHRELFHNILEQMRNDSEQITAAVHMLFIAKNLERIGDFATGIAEQVHFLVNGELPREARHKVSITDL